MDPYRSKEDDMRTCITMTEDEVREACADWLNEHAGSEFAINVEYIRLDVGEKATLSTGVRELEINVVAEWDHERDG